MGGICPAAMLVRASRDGDLEVVLRLLYTNPFVDGQELRNALWEAVRCRQLEVLRSLLEFRVDPAGAASPEVSQPPSPLRHVPWTPLLALAVNDCGERAQIVAELVGSQRHDPAGSTIQSSPSQPRKTTSSSSEVCHPASFTGVRRSSIPSLPTPLWAGMDDSPPNSLITTEPFITTMSPPPEQ